MSSSSKPRPRPWWVALVSLVALGLRAAACQSAPPPAPTQAPAKAAAATTAPPAQAQPAAKATSAPAPAPAPTQAAPAVEQKLMVGTGALPKTLDPNTDAGLYGNLVYSLLYDTFVRVDDKGNVIPGLAESWKTWNDRTWQFKLRKGVKFHNGEVFDAQAAKFNFERVMDSKSVWANRFTLIEGVDVVDDSTVNVRTKDSFATLDKNSFQIYLVPPKYLKEKGDQAFINAPVATGPFKFKEWKQDSYVTVEANPDYWGGAPKLKTLTVRAYPEASTMVASLEKGEIDVAYNVPPDDVARLKGKGFNIVSRNMGQSQIFILRATMDSPIAKKEVRQALNYAIDKQVIVDKLLGGYGRVLDGQLVGPEAFGYNPNLKPYPYDPARAKKMLADAGYPNGFKVKMHGSIGRWIKDKEVSEAVATQLAEVGVQVDLEILESAVWYDMWRQGSSGPIVIQGSSWAPLLDPDQNHPFYLSDKRGQNVLRSVQFDALYDKQKLTMDPKEREKVLFQMAEVFRDEAPMIFMHQMPGVYAVNQKVQGIDFTAYWAMKNLTTMSIK